LSVFAIVKYRIKSYNKVKIQLHAHQNILDFIRTKEEHV